MLTISLRRNTPSIAAPVAIVFFCRVFLSCLSVVSFRRVFPSCLSVVSFRRVFPSCLSVTPAFGRGSHLSEQAHGIDVDTHSHHAIWGRSGDGQ